VHGFLGWFDARVGNEWLSTSPNRKQTHWRQVFLPLENPIQVQEGDSITFELKRPEYGEWSWIAKHKDSTQKQSTFHSTPIKPNDLFKQADSYRGDISSEGMAITFILQKLDGKNTTTSISDELVKKYPDLFPNRQSAHIFTKKIVKHYST